MAQIYQSNLGLLFTIKILEYAAKCRQNPILKIYSQKINPLGNQVL